MRARMRSEPSVADPTTTPLSAAISAGSAELLTAARARADEAAQVDKELHAEAPSCEGGSLGEERCKQHHGDCYAYEDGKRRVKKRDGIVGHDIVDARCEGEVHGRQHPERADLRLR